MVNGLLMGLDDHSCWAIAEAVGHCGPHRLQHLLSRAVWDDRQMLDTASAWAAEHLDDGDTVLIANETADEKSSADCVGATRRYTGTVCGIAVCQIAVTSTYAASRGPALIGRALYLPERCAADAEHRELAGVADEVMFAAKPQLASALLNRANALGIRAAFVAGDEVYADVSCAGASASAGWAMCWRCAPTHTVTTGSSPHRDRSRRGQLGDA
jgi:SRSO17 transposase